MIRKLLLVFFTCFSFLGFAQNNDSLHFSINIVPQYLIIGGIRTDIEFKITNKINVFAGWNYYSGTINTSGSETKTGINTSSNVDQSQRANDNLEGNGWNTGIKYYFLKDKDYNYYVGVDLTSNKFNITIKDYDYFPYVEDGLTFYEYRLGKIEADSKQFGYHLSFGATTTYKRFVANGWFGAGYTDTELSKDFDKYRKYNSFSGQYAYQGWAPYLGLKLGFLLF